MLWWMEASVWSKRSMTFSSLRELYHFPSPNKNLSACTCSYSVQPCAKEHLRRFPSLLPPLLRCFIHLTYTPYPDSRLGTDCPALLVGPLGGIAEGCGGYGGCHWLSALAP